jgi:HSP20 family protein
MLTRFSDWNAWPSFGYRDNPSSFAVFDQLRRELDRALSGFSESGNERQFGARLTLSDNGAAFVVSAELPGLAQKDLDLQVTATTVTLRGERKMDAPQGYTVHRSERTGYRFARSFELPSKIDPDKVEATLVNGVLTVTLPKAAEAQPKQITVKVS